MTGTISPVELERLQRRIGGRRGKAPRRRRQPKPGEPPYEEVEQRALAEYLDLCGLRWCHVPNGGDRHGAVAGKLKSEGVKTGVPDVLIFTRPDIAGVRGVAIELKRRKGGKTSAEQLEWLADLRAEGWMCKVCVGWEDAAHWLGVTFGWSPRTPVRRGPG